MSIETGDLFSENNEEPELIQEIQRNPPEDWDDPIKKLNTLISVEPGFLSTMIHRNPELYSIIEKFLLGDKDITVIGGESGMGKSLMAAELQILHRHLNMVLPEERRSNLAVITWDRTHEAVYNQFSTEIGQTIRSPKGETPLSIRQVVSGIMENGVGLVHKYQVDTKILLEAPLIGTRAETVFEESHAISEAVQTIIMHSSDQRNEILNRGSRLVDTSGQPEAMAEMREKLMFVIDKEKIAAPAEEQDEIIKNWWRSQLRRMNGVLVEWSQFDDVQRYKHTIENFKTNNILPDRIFPRAFSQAMQNQIQAVFKLIAVDSIIRDII